MHHAFIGAALLGLVYVAFGERATRILAQLLCLALASGALFFAYVLFCAWRNTYGAA